MANFKPLKNHFIFCLDQAIRAYNLSGPFLDVGCGTGDVSLHLAKKGWSGQAIDFSNTAVREAQQRLSEYRKIKMEKMIYLK